MISIEAFRASYLSNYSLICSIAPFCQVCTSSRRRTRSFSSARSQTSSTGNVSFPLARSVPKDSPAAASDPNKSMQSSWTWYAVPKARPNCRKLFRCSAVAPLRQPPSSDESAKSSAVFISNTLKYLSRVNSKSRRCCVCKISPEQTVFVAMATNTVCSGEILQTQHRRDFEFTRDKYFKVLEMKTAELFALSSELGGCLSGATAEQRNSLRQFGLAFGTAYQVHDDCIDLFGSEAAAGKSLGTDLAKGKLTLPVLLVWERADEKDRVRLRELVQTWQNGAIEQMSELLLKYEALNASIEIIRQYLEQSRRVLRGLPASSGRSGLFGITEYLEHQTGALGESA